MQKWGVVLLLGVALAVGTVPAEGQIVALWNNGWTCEIPMFGTLQLVVIGVDIKGARFQISDGLDCGTSEIFDITPSPGVLLSGNASEGFEVEFECGDYLERTTVATVNYYHYGTPCCPLKVLPHPGAVTGDVEVIACDGSAIASQGGTLYYESSGDCPPDLLIPPPQAPDPPNLSTGRPVEQLLSFTQPRYLACCCGVLSEDIFCIYFGSETPPPRVCCLCEGLLSPGSRSTWDPGVLEPNTTYYWQVSYRRVDMGASVSPIWSFTTGDVVPVTPTTWGRVKSLFD
jgi:hypothetical protein